MVQRRKKWDEQLNRMGDDNLAKIVEMRDQQTCGSQQGQGRDGVNRFIIKAVSRVRKRKKVTFSVGALLL